MARQGDWRVALLRQIGAPTTKKNMEFLSTWQRWEGGHTHNDARFNWLNTTMEAPGAVGSINSVGVKRFDSFQNGVTATARTLMNGKYDDIVAGLTAGDPYKFKPIAGLSTWVSGSPTARPDYAAKVLGQAVAAAKRVAKAKAPATEREAPKRPRPPSSKDVDNWNWTMQFIFGDDDPAFAASLLRDYQTYEPEVKADYGPTNRKGDPHAGHGHEAPMKFNGKVLNPGTSWSGSHVTDGLNWNNGRRTATDIMARPGTAVVAPESGIVVRHGSAQGGQAMYFLSDRGRLYWLGHIDAMTPVGTRVKAGQRLALISADHAAPHLHIDRYEGDGRSWLK